MDVANALASASLQSGGKSTRGTRSMRRDVSERCDDAGGGVMDVYTGDMTDTGICDDGDECG